MTKGELLPEYAVAALRAQGIELPDGAVVVSVSINVGHIVPARWIEVEYQIGNIRHRVSTGEPPVPPPLLVVGRDCLGNIRPTLVRQGRDLPEPDPDNFWSKGGTA